MIPYQPNDGLYKAYIGVLIMTIMIMIACIMSGCSTTRYIPVPEYHTDSIYISRIQHDSVVTRDSVITYIKGDSVTIYKERVREKYLTLTDTLYKERVDSVYVPYEVKVEKKLSWTQRIQIDTWPILALLVISAVLYYTIRRFFS